MITPIEFINGHNSAKNSDYSFKCLGARFVFIDGQMQKRKQNFVRGTLNNKQLKGIIYNDVRVESGCTQVLVQIPYA